MLPSGNQFTIRHGAHEAVIVSVGGGVRTYQFAGRDLIDGYPETEVCDGARGQLLIPWPNRVKDGSFNWRGVSHQLAITEPTQHTAIHGLLRWVSWELQDQTDSALSLTSTIHPQPGWPWPLHVVASYQLSDDGLQVQTTVTNAGTEDAPMAVGAHPYLKLEHTIDEAMLRIPANNYLPTGDQQIPTGTEPVQGTDWDWRTPRQVGKAEIDYAFGDLIRDADGKARVTLTDSEGLGVQLWVDEQFPWVEVFTGDALPDPQRRRRGLGVEPMSAPPNGLATGEGVVVLAPGEAWSGCWGIAPYDASRD